MDAKKFEDLKKSLTDILEDTNINDIGDNEEIKNIVREISKELSEVFKEKEESSNELDSEIDESNRQVIVNYPLLESMEGLRMDLDFYQIVEDGIKLIHQCDDERWNEVMNQYTEEMEYKVRHLISCGKRLSPVVV